MTKPNELSLDAKLLRLFLGVFDNNSVSLTAKEMDISQAAVSRGLDRLRKVFEDQLFIKSGRGITATDKALILEPRIREVAASLEGLLTEVDYDPLSDEKPIGIATNVELANPIFTTLRERLKADASEKKVKIIELGSRFSLVDSLNRDDVDVAVSIRPTQVAPILDSVNLAQDSLKVFYDPKHSKAPDTLERYLKARHAVVDFGSNDKSEVSLFLESQSITRNVAWAVPNFDALALLVEGSDLIVTQRAALHKATFRNLSVCDTPVEFPMIYTDLFWHRRNEHSERNEWIRDLFS